MVTVAHIVKKLVGGRPVLVETMNEGIINYAALAETMHKEIEGEVGKKVKRSAIVMAIRRYAEEMKPLARIKPKSFFGTEILLKSGIVDIAVTKSGTLPAKLEKLYKVVDFRKGDILNLIHGNNEVGIITNEKNLEKIMKILEFEEVLFKEQELAFIALSMSRDHLYTPGVIFQPVRKLMWDNVNIYEIISTSTELIFIIAKKDASKAYNSLQDLLSS
jgi:aspartokinase